MDLSVCLSLVDLDPQGRRGNTDDLATSCLLPSLCLSKTHLRTNPLMISQSTACFHLCVCQRHISTHKSTDDLATSCLLPSLCLSKTHKYLSTNPPMMCAWCVSAVTQHQVQNLQQLCKPECNFIPGLDDNTKLTAVSAKLIEVNGTGGKDRLKSMALEVNEEVVQGQTSGWLARGRSTGSWRGADPGMAGAG